MLDLTVVLSEVAYLKEAVIYSLLEGDLIHTDCCLSLILASVLSMPCRGPIDL